MAFSPSQTFFEIKQDIYRHLNGIFEDPFDVDATGEAGVEENNRINNTITLQISMRNAPSTQGGKRGRQSARNDELCDLIMEETIVNESVESGNKFKLSDYLDKMKEPRPLIFAVILKGSPHNQVYFKDLRPVFKAAPKPSESGKFNSRGGIQMKECFEQYSVEETLGGDDQWYCSNCKEHRDITRRLELWKVPKIMCIHLKRFTTRKSANRGRGGLMGMAIA